MLTITGLADAEYLIDGVALGVEDYYVGAGEAPGVWQGRLAAELGLAGVVDPDQLRALLLARDPTTDAELLVAKGRPRTVTAHDVTFSAPKSVSLLWTFASPDVAAVASIAHVEAVAVGLDLLERRAGATRQQIDGRAPADPDRRGVRHLRAPDQPGGRPATPHPLRGCESRSSARRNLRRARCHPDLRVGSGRRVRLPGGAATAPHRAARGGVGAGPHGCREMVGFDPGWLRTFSKRTQAIDEYLAGAGPEHPDPEAADAGGRGGITGHPAPQGRFAHPGGPPPTVAGRGGRRRDADRPRPRGRICGRAIPTVRPRVEWDTSSTP